MIVLELLHTDYYFDNGYFEKSSKVFSEYFFLLAFVCAHYTFGANSQELTEETENKINQVLS